MSYSGSGSDEEIFGEDWPARSSPSATGLSEVLQSPSPQRAIAPKRRKQPSDPKDKFDLTVMGTLFNLFEAHTQPLGIEYLTNYIASRLDILRRPDGSRYSKSPEKIVIACLSNTDVFTKTPLGWILRPHNAERFKEKMLETLIHRVNRKGEPRTEAALQEFKRVKNSDKAYKTVLLFERLGRYLRGNKEFAQHFRKPFGKLNGGEEITDVAQALGNEKFLGVLIGCEMLKDYFSGLCYRATSLPDPKVLSQDLKLLHGLAETALCHAQSRFS